MVYRVACVTKFLQVLIFPFFFFFAVSTAICQKKVPTKKNYNKKFCRKNLLHCGYFDGRWGGYGL